LNTLGNQINTVTYQSVGIILRVTPFITGDGMVEMIVSPETSALADRSQWVPISSAARRLDHRSGHRLAFGRHGRGGSDGQTAVIGGLMEKQQNAGRQQNSFAGRHSLYWAISSNERSSKTTKTELIIFLTPHIVAEPTQLAGVSAKERSDTTMVPKAFSEQELNRFLTMSLAGKSAACEEPEVTPRCPTPL